MNLSSGISLSSSSSSLITLLSSSNLNAIKSIPLCTSNNDCFISFSRDSILDMVGLTVLERPDGHALPVFFIPDSLSPSLVSFDEFNLNNHSITITMDETINIHTINFTSIVLQCLFENPLSSIQLKYSASVGQINSTKIYYNLNIMDIDRIKLNPFVCNYRGDCYIKLFSSFIKDMSGNSISEVS